MTARRWVQAALALRKVEALSTCVAIHTIWCVHVAADVCAARAAHAFGREATDEQLVELVEMAWETR